MNIIEHWLTLKDFPHYEISTLGRIRSNKKQKPIILKKYTRKSGYEAVILRYNGKAYYRYVHRLIAQTFLPNPENYPQVNHINEVKNDNRVDNIEWCTAKQNLNYGTRNERISKTSKGKTKNEVHYILQYTKDNVLINVFESSADAERKTGIHHCMILNVCKGLFHTSGGYIWRYGGVNTSLKKHHNTTSSNNNG